MVTWRRKKRKIDVEEKTEVLMFLFYDCLYQWLYIIIIFVTNMRSINE